MYTLLIVDDEVELRDGLTNHFPWEKYGFKALASCGSAQDALDFLASHPVDVVLTDIRMPFMSGLDLIRTLKEAGSEETVFCILSAHRDFDYAQEGIALGVRHYLLKPTDFEEIGEAFSAIREELDKNRSEKITLTADTESMNHHVRRALEMISHHPGTVSLQNTAEELGVSTAYLSRLFKEETGKNFSALLGEAKMKKAAELLRAPAGYTNGEIAAMLGYGDPQNFCRSFKRCYGTTPLRYRTEGPVADEVEAGRK